MLFIPSTQSLRSGVWGHFHLCKIILAVVIQLILINGTAFITMLGTTDLQEGIDVFPEVTSSSTTLQVHIEFYTRKGKLCPQHMQINTFFFLTFPT